MADGRRRDNQPNGEGGGSSFLGALNLRAVAIAIGAPVVVTAVALFVDDRRIGFPVLLYLLGVVAAISAGRVAGGIIASVVSGIGLVILLTASDTLSSEDDARSVLSMFLVVLVALVLAYAISSMQSARRDAEDAEHDLRLLIDGAGDTALFKLDRAGRVESWNAGAERLLGYTAKQAIGLELSAFLTEDENEEGKAGNDARDRRAWRRLRGRGLARPQGRLADLGALDADADAQRVRRSARLRPRHPRSQRAQAPRGSPVGARAARLAHPAPEPRPLPPAPRRRDRARPPHEVDAVAALRRPRRLQGRQRQPRPCCG